MYSNNKYICGGSIDYIYTYVQWQIVRIARFQRPVELDLRVRGILKAGINHVVLGVILDGCGVSMRRTVTVLQIRGENKHALVIQFRLLARSRPPALSRTRILNYFDVHVEQHLFAYI